jgi:adenosylcobinamide-phosphate synthase
MRDRQGSRVEWKDRGIVLALALSMDALLGDPPNRYHPVAWMGSAIGYAQRGAPEQGARDRLVYGGLIASGGTILVAAIGWVLAWVLLRLTHPLRWLGMATLLKTTLSLRGLGQAASEVHQALKARELEKARRLVSWHLVSRDTSQLSEAQVSAAAIESVAENTSDGVIAPLFYFSLFGLPGALAYRFANTCDSMLGYRDASREWLGKLPARFDDLLNLIPARLTALALVTASVLTGDDPSGAFSIWLRDRHKTQSPNAGHPMSAAAGALGVQLEKVGQYRLGAGNRQPTPDDIPRAQRLTWAATLIASAGLVLIPLILRKRK